MEGKLISEETYRAVFDKYSEDKETVALDDVSKIVSELGKDGNADEYSNIFGSKNFKEGQVSFEMFYKYCKQIDEGKCPKELAGKMKINLAGTKLFKIIKKSIADNGVEGAGGVGGVGQQPQNTELDWKLQVGEGNYNTKCDLQVKVGPQKEQITNQLGFCNLADDRYYVILNLKTADSQKAQEDLKAIIEQVFAMAEAMLPPDFQSIKESIEIDYFTPNGSDLYVRISSNHPFVQEAHQQSQQVHGLFNPEVSIDVLFQTSLSIATLIAAENKEKEIAEVFLNNLASNMHVHVEGGSSMMKTLKDLVNQQFEQLKKKQQPLTFILFLFSSLKVDLKLNDVSCILEQFKLMTKNNDPNPNMQSFIDKSPLQEMTQSYQGMSEELPLVSEVVEFFRTQVTAEMNLFVITPLASMKMSCCLPGVGALVDSQLNQ